MYSRFRQAHNCLMKIFSSIRKHLSWCSLFPWLWMDLWDNAHMHLWLVQYSFHNLCPSKYFIGLTSSFPKQNILSIGPVSPTFVLASPLLMFLMDTATFYLLILLLLLPSFSLCCFLFLLMLCLFIFLYNNFYKDFLVYTALPYKLNGLSPSGLTVGPILAEIAGKSWQKW